jgi:hypothetical protein
MKQSSHENKYRSTELIGLYSNEVTTKQVEKERVLEQERSMASQRRTHTGNELGEHLDKLKYFHIEKKCTS